jgi:uncharacterized membrane protein
LTDQKLELIVANLLRAGVSLSAAVVLAGGIWYLADSPHTTPDYSSFQPTLIGLHSLEALRGPELLILIGLLTLIATPVARVIFALAAFALEKDYAYMVITAAVLLVLLYSIGTSFL